MPHLSQAFRFLQSSYFRQAQSALIGQLTQSIVIGRTPQARVRNVTPLSIIVSFSFLINVKTVNNVLSFPISSSPRGEQSRDRHSNEARMYLHTCRGCDVSPWTCLIIKRWMYNPHKRRCSPGWNVCAWQATDKQSTLWASCVSKRSNAHKICKNGRLGEYSLKHSLS